MNNKKPNTSKVRAEQVSKSQFDNIYLGVDVHKKSVTVARIIDGATPEKPRLMSWERFWDFSIEQARQARKVHAVYEAGALGFSPCRKLEGMGINGLVIHPEKLDPRNRRVQNDKNDSLNLSLKLQRYVCGNNKAMTKVYVPTENEEFERLAARHRDNLSKEIQSLQARGRGYLLNFGIFDNNGWYRASGWEKLQPRLNSTLARVLGQMRETIEHLNKQLAEAEKELEQAAPAQLPKGFGKLTFELLTRSLCNYERFKSRRQVAGFTGLCGGVSASGDYHMDLSINKAGSPRVRALLIEAAWRMIRFQPGYTGLRTWKKMGAATAAKRRRKIALVATARQLLVDIWKWQTGRTTPEALGWVMTEAS